jgi:hypothetical protein
MSAVLSTHDPASQPAAPSSSPLVGSVSELRLRPLEDQRAAGRNLQLTSSHDLRVASMPRPPTVIAS